MKLEYFRQVLEKYSKMKFHENPSNGSRVVPCGQTDWQTAMKKPIVAFLNYANAPNQQYIEDHLLHFYVSFQYYIDGPMTVC